jgi:hypothetical protein
VRLTGRVTGTGPKIPAHDTGTVQLCVTCMEIGKVHTVSLNNAYYVPTQPLNISSSHDVRVLGGAVHLDDGFEPSYVRWSGSSCPVYQAVK